ncbi:MAG TPA: DUF4199 domain-containing protein [Puia sp.]
MKSGKISIAVTCGLIAGLVLILLTTLLYLGGVNSFLGYGGWFGYLLLISAAVVAPVMKKKAQNGFLEFREALKDAFLVFVIALLLQTLFIWILMNFIDTNFRDALEQAILAKTEQLLQRFGAHQEDIDTALARQKGRNQYALSSLLLGLCVSYVVFFLISLVIAAIVKRKKPEFHDTAFKQ